MRCGFAAFAMENRRHGPHLRPQGEDPGVYDRGTHHHREQLGVVCRPQRGQGEGLLQAVSVTVDPRAVVQAVRATPAGTEGAHRGWAVPAVLLSLSRRLRARAKVSPGLRVSGQEPFTGPD